MKKYNKLEVCILVLISIILSLFIVLILSCFNTITIDDLEVSLSSNRPDKFYNLTEMKFDFSDELIDNLKEKWSETGKNEYGACISSDFITGKDELLNREHSKDIIMFDKITKFVEGKDGYVPGIYCDGSDTMIHKHPKSGCKSYLWSGDVGSAIQSFKRGNRFYMIQCEENKIEVYNRNNLYNSKVLVFG